MALLSSSPPRTLVASPPDRRRDRRRIRRRRPNRIQRARVHRGHGRAGLARRLRRPRGQRAHGEGRTSRRPPPHTPTSYNTTRPRLPAPRAYHPPSLTTHPRYPLPSVIGARRVRFVPSCQRHPPRRRHWVQWARHPRGLDRRWPKVRRRQGSDDCAGVLVLRAPLQRRDISLWLDGRYRRKPRVRPPPHLRRPPPPPPPSPPTVYHTLTPSGLVLARHNGRPALVAAGGC